ncbi:MAG: protein kinase [Polyangiaceae bacterium]|nr:protein kinase [Polyangiaceae bacterium]
MERALPDATSTSDPPGGERAGRYELFAEIGSGGMAKVYLGRLLGAAGFARTVAIKRPLLALTRDVDFRRAAINEARLAARVQHPHVVSTLDVVEQGDELLIVMEYVHGESLAALAAEARERGARLPPGVVVSLVAGALRGLQALHEARDERGNLLGLIHGDVSPQNVLVGVEGLARLSDFGLAKAAGGISLTGHDEFKGKLTYASPEQLGLRPLSPATDLYSMGLVLWELLVGERLYAGLTAAEIVARLLAGGHVAAPSRHVEGIPLALDAVVERATRFEPTERFESAQEMAAALEACASPAPVGYVAAWVRSLAAGPLIERERHLLMAERQTTPSKLGGSLAPEIAPEIAQESPEASPATSPEGSAGTSPEAVPEGGSPLTTLVSAQPVPKPQPPFEFALTMPVGPLVSPTPSGSSRPPGPLRSSVPPPPAGPFASPVPPRRFVSSVPPVSCRRCRRGRASRRRPPGLVRRWRLLAR